MIRERRQMLKWLAASGLTLGASRLFGQGMASRGVSPAPRPKFSGRPFPVTLTDVARSAGLRAPIIYGSAHRKRYIYESNGSGIAFFDYDNDGWLDIFEVSGKRLKAAADSSEPTNRLYHNNRDGTFTDVTEKAGLIHTGWGYGVCVGDYDNDGNDDLFLTYYGKNVLYHNNGDGTFTDVTKASGLAQSEPRFGTGCTFVDYDRDGHLDLFVANYINLNGTPVPAAGSNRYCEFEGVAVACGPLGLPKEHCALYHNNGNGTFTDVSLAAGILKPGGRYGLTAVAFDYDNDGWPDLFAACDSTPNLLFHNNRDGTFTNVALDVGVAVNGDGQEQANMGVAVGDYDNKGFLDLFLTHFSGDTPGLLRNDQGQFFDDLTYAAGLAVITQYVSWGAGFVDLDNDGWLDLLEVTGSVYPLVEKTHPDYPFKTPRVVFRNLGNGDFEDVSFLAGPGIRARHSSRGCAFGDFNNDGRVDALIMNEDEHPSLLRNDGPNTNHWLIVKLKGSRSNRTAIGARLILQTSHGRQIREIQSGSSYISQSDLRQHFGLGSESKVQKLVIRWPNGAMETFSNLESDRFVTIVEGKGIVRNQQRP